jgi:hypothetical protein
MEALFMPDLASLLKLPLFFLILGVISLIAVPIYLAQW